MVFTFLEETFEFLIKFQNKSKLFFYFQNMGWLNISRKWKSKRRNLHIEEMFVSLVFENLKSNDYQTRQSINIKYSKAF